MKAQDLGITTYNPFDDEKPCIWEDADCMVVCLGGIYPDNQLDFSDLNYQRLKDAMSKNINITWPPPFGVWRIKKTKQ